MAKTGATCPNHAENDKRAAAKAKRGKGRFAMKGMSHPEWTQKHDPLFKVKGKERHMKLHKPTSIYLN